MFLWRTSGTSYHLIGNTSFGVHKIKTWVPRHGCSSGHSQIHNMSWTSLWLCTFLFFMLLELAFYVKAWLLICWIRIMRILKFILLSTVTTMTKDIELCCKIIGLAVIHPRATMFNNVQYHRLWTYNSPKSNMILWRSCNSAFVSMLILTRRCRRQMHNIVFSKKTQLDAKTCFEKGHLPWASLNTTRQRFCSCWIWNWAPSTIITRPDHPQNDY